MQISLETYVRTQPTNNGWKTTPTSPRKTATTTHSSTRRTGMDEVDVIISPLRDLRSVLEHYLLTSGWHREAHDQWTQRDLFCACISLPFAVKKQLEHEDGFPFKEAS